MSGSDPFQPHSVALPGLDATAALHPWDEEVFGFRTGGLVLGLGPASQEDGATLREWMRNERVALLVANAPAEDPGARLRLHDLGFQTVEESFTVALPRLRRIELPETPVRLRTARAEDQAGLEDLATRAFRFGRFHTDPRFPADLAGRRMARWVGRALESPDPADTVLVMEGEEAPLGFFHVRNLEGRASLRLGAVDPLQNAGLGGYGLFVETLRWLREAGTRSVVAEIAAANTAVVNIYARLGFHFTRLEVTMHLHAPDAPYLLP